MLDPLQELKEPSESLQSRDITVVRANQLIAREVRVFRSMKDRDGEYVTEPSRALADGKFKEIQLTAPKANSVTINKNQFFVCLTTIHHHSLHMLFKVLDPDNSPDGDEMELFGDKEVSFLYSVRRQGSEFSVLQVWTAHSSSPT